MSARIARRSIALAVAALVLGFAGTSTARADHRDHSRHDSVRIQSRHWQNNVVRRPYFRDDDCRRQVRVDSFRSCNPPRRYDSRFGISINVNRRDFGRNCGR